MAGDVSLILAIFALEWDRVHEGKLFHRIRIFNERNVLETYQPRAKTMEDFFEVEPPIPAQVLLRRNQEDKGQFKRTRDAVSLFADAWTWFGDMCLLKSSLLSSKSIESHNRTTIIYHVYRIVRAQRL